jgi:hypothetical protein
MVSPLTKLGTHVHAGRGELTNLNMPLILAFCCLHELAGGAYVLCDMIGWQS